MSLGDKERRCLEFLSDKMDAFAYEIGKAIHPEWSPLIIPRSSFSHAGSNVAEILEHRGLVVALRHKKSQSLSYRITEQGRIALAAIEPLECFKSEADSLCRIIRLRYRPDLSMYHVPADFDAVRLLAEALQAAYESGRRGDEP